MQQNGIGISYSTNNHQQTSITSDNGCHYVETRIEDGKLLYEKRWFHRGQQIFVEGKDLPKFAATITAIGNEVVSRRKHFLSYKIFILLFFKVWVKKVNDNSSSKVKINMSHLAKGKVVIKRRAN